MCSSLSVLLLLRFCLLLFLCLSCDCCILILTLSSTGFANVVKLGNLLCGFGISSKVTRLKFEPRAMKMINSKFFDRSRPISLVLGLNPEPLSSIDSLLTTALSPIFSPQNSGQCHSVCLSPKI